MAVTADSIVTIGPYKYAVVKLSHADVLRLQGTFKPDEWQAITDAGVYGPIIDGCILIGTYDFVLIYEKFDNDERIKLDLDELTKRLP